jgi:hypothetical protein
VGVVIPRCASANNAIAPTSVPDAAEPGVIALDAGEVRIADDVQIDHVVRLSAATDPWEA